MRTVPTALFLLCSIAALMAIQPAVSLAVDSVPIWVSTSDDLREAPGNPQHQESFAPTLPRTPDPYIQAIVDQMTQADFMPTWQALDDFETRFVSTPQNAQAVQWAFDRFRSFGLRTEFHPFSVYRNVIATLPGLVDSTRVIYLTAHIDSWSPEQVCAPGADDNGSGSAAVIEAARILSQHPAAYTIKFALFNSEEQGHVGATAYVALIASQGEDVIGAFNCDQIAYRGIDPAPPDLLIVTDANSQALAASLAGAVNDYLPGRLEPVVYAGISALGDHWAFWHNGYKAVCSSADLPTGPDVSPWMHTCEDRIEQYPTDFVLDCARANLAAVAVTAQLQAPPGPEVWVAGSTIDDDNVGNSEGNGDGILNPGETIELWVDLHNWGGVPESGLSGRLAPTAQAVVLDSTASWNDIPAGGQGTSLTPFLFQVSDVAAGGSMVRFDLNVTGGSGTCPLGLWLFVAAPELTYYTHRLDDSTLGNNNGIIDPGELLQIPVSLLNTGGADAEPVQAQLSSMSEHAIVVEGTSGVASIPVGAHAELSPPFTILISPDAPLGEVLTLGLSAAAGLGAAMNSEFKIKVGTGFYDELETSTGWSLSLPGDNALNGRWVNADPIGTWVGGQPCEPEDDHTAAPGIRCMVTGQGLPGGNADGSDLDNGRTTLTSPVVDLSRVVNPRVTYWRWFTNHLGSNPNDDWWEVTISNDGGNYWVYLEQTTESANVWQEKSFLISQYLTPTDQMVLRFLVSDLGGASLVEAAVDDLEFTGEGPAGILGENPYRTVMLASPRPSPSAGNTILQFALPGRQRAELQVFNVEGRLIRTLANGVLAPGLHQLVWDGRNNAGLDMGPGVYFVSLRTDGAARASRLVRIR